MGGWLGARRLIWVSGGGGALCCRVNARLSHIKPPSLLLPPRLWVRNGASVARIEFHSRSSIRAELCLDPDMFALQAWIATAQDTDGEYWGS